MQYLGIDIGSPGLCWGKKEQTASVHVPLMIGTVMSHNSRIPAAMDNPISYAQADGNDSMSSTPFS